ncbi:ArsC family transcriptional regulator [bacterium (Candidatus Blackallbacteria) CG17_big_fil_post_rev_8_21_14_2_50_48_46]|uniref:ArsC family transcriptional regulator n=1 Tax=bacterium (Candidatus Blackallbacteria) CG17_big_fil_post_rev_8_21_14_2_50_48_46 TaxID=2014261 RepID=A0A2M7G0N5_9BACT|nr:MAG: ArsC family transcriptional regulator [bacterium (Candidatus Blackallbacteria) CG18_big_fil_WC_8_21_14_2_50_49_26]PIW15275.1 MAG: ArsC family transcriptional regulator [bacterium (Candidatus Blackallbacteria) CG17_big_fil_post_rev_8_21_14_2_50_48_46]PIW45216.1 MAG: ArsC family transcriptional regulator [bacterium (Candidatus Blackallbacteria) CG13_big_fil_rev_8_21_14_2_50_49_14]
MSNLQIFGTRKCSETRKAERFFKERGQKFQFIDLKETKISKGELNSIRKSVPLKDLINTQGAEYQKRNLKYIVHDIETELLEHPLLLMTPIVRQGPKATVGFQPEIWKTWLA